jgi:hypothetical protein
MPIPVTCSECQYHFLVGDEFAGRPGRCPECAAVLHVPGPEIDPLHPHADPFPERIPRAADSFDDFPSRVRRRREEVRERDRYEDEIRDDFDDRPRGGSFDPHARAAKWESVSRGLRNLMIAVILMAVAEMISCAFALIDGVRAGQQNDFGPKEQALIIGNTLFSVIAMVLWAMGRIGCGRVPYVPARRIAFPAGIIAGITTVCGVLAYGGFVGGLLLARQNPAVGALILLLGVCAFMPVLVGFPVAEVMGLVSQVKMATGLRDVGFSRASRVQLVVALLLTTLTLFGMCILAVFFMGEMQKAQQQQMQQQQQQPNGGAAAPAPGGKGNGPAAKNNQAGGQQPPPQFDPADYPALVYGVTIGRLLVILSYAAVSITCFQLGRKAIRREVDALVGNPHDRDPVHDPY